MIFSKHFLEQVANSKFVEQIRNGTLTVDNSEFSVWNACVVAGMYNGALKRVSARSRSPLAFGDAIHKGLESFFRGEADWLAKAHAAADANGLADMGDSRRTVEKMEELLTSYVMEYARHADMQFDIVTIGGVPAVEQSFVVPLGETGPIDLPSIDGLTNVKIMWSGKIDLLVRHEGGIAPVDHKTTTVMGEKFVDDKIRSTQMHGYTYAARFFSDSCFGGAPVYGTVINALAMRSAGFEFKQFPIAYADWKVAEWQKETIAATRQLLLALDTFLRTGEAVPIRDHCVTKYGKCPYFDVCDSVPLMRDRMIFDDSYYYVSTWSPLGE